MERRGFVEFIKEAKCSLYNIPNIEFDNSNTGRCLQHNAVLVLVVLLGLKRI